MRGMSKEQNNKEVRRSKAREINKKAAVAAGRGGEDRGDINKVRGKCERRREWIDCCPAAQETIMEQQRS